MYATCDPQRISLLTALFSTSRRWTALKSDDELDASYRHAIELLITAGFVDAKIEAVVTMQDRLGSMRLIYQCHGPSQKQIEEHAREQARHNREWCDKDGWVRGALTVTQRPLAVRLSAISIDDLQLDRPNVRTKAIPILVDKLVERMTDDDLCATPEITLMEIGHTAPTGPDPENAGVFYWQGEGYKLSKRNWELLCTIWGHDEANYSDVGELVWKNDLTPASTIRKQINRLNQWMGDNDIPLAWRIEAQQIVPEA